MSVFRQLQLLLWKNFVLQIRRPIGTIVELILPPLAVVVLIILKYELIAKPVDKCFVTFDSDHLVPPLDLTGTVHTVYYAPDTIDTLNVTKLAIRKFPSGLLKFVAVADEASLTNITINTVDSRQYGCFLKGSAVYFDNLQGNNLEYTIRLKNDELNPRLTAQSAPGVILPGARVDDNYYLTQGFLHLQNAIGQAIIEWKTNQSVDVPIDVRQFPYPQYRQDLFLSAISFAFPLFAILAFMYSFAYFVKELVIEKETRIRESMKMMGLSQWVLWMSWYIKQFLFLLISVLVLSILLKFGQIYPKSSWFLLLAYFLTFSLTLISFGYLVSVFFSSARVALVVAFLIWFAFLIPYLFIATKFDSLSLGTKVALCLLSNTCMGLAINVFSALELRQEGAQFSNFAEPLSVDDPFNLMWVCGMLIFDAILYMVIAWYVDAIRPGEYGVPRPFYFPFLPSYWMGRSYKITPLEAAPMKDGHSNMLDFEDEPKDMEAGISIRHLRKVYRGWPKKPKVAVEDISLTMYRGHITALLGHNGAGKTTTMSILTGLYTPTSGDAIVNGHSILREMDQVRKSLGICPQHNVLFDPLTVREHLWFFMKLKGIDNKKKVDAEVAAMIEDLLLVDKTNVPSSQLSGGMKRKLSVAIALIGGSQVVILDEPTSGMDPYARRATWDLLVKHKKGRTVLLTTHHMDEADLLGDRIAIMAEGRLRCSGSPLFLKNRYGIGYHMTMVKEASCDSRQVAELVLRSVDGAQQTTDVGAELSFILPSACTHQFPAMFEQLEAHQKELGISSYGVSVTTLEEVFIKVGAGSDHALGPPRIHTEATPPYNSYAPPTHLPPPDLSLVVFNLEDNDEQQTATLPFGGTGTTTFRPSIIDLASSVAKHGKRKTTIPSYSLNSGPVLWFQQFYAILLKRFYNTIRFWGSLVTQLFLPLLLVLLGLVLSKTLTDNNTDSPKRLLSVKNSATSTSNITFFWASFGNAGINFSSVNHASLGMTDFLDYTGAVNDIIGGVGNYSDVSQCCSYQHQLLDQFCANASSEVLAAKCTSSSTFGYKPCLQCLSCCYARSNLLPSCTNAVSTNFIGSADNLCPVPPKLPPTTGSAHIQGPLQDKAAFVAEYLLNVSNQETPLIFFNRFQGGFVVSPRDPAFSVCSSPDPVQTNKSFIDPVLGALQGVTCSGDSTSNSSQLSLNLFPCFNCPNYYKPNSTCPSPSSSPSPLPSCYSVDAFSTSCFQNEACSLPESAGGVSATYVPQVDDVAITVWYNNVPFHMSAAALNALHNIILQQRPVGVNMTISVNNYPLPRDLEEQISTATQTFLGYTVGTMVVFGYSFLLASYVLFLVQERESKAKHLQFVSGVYVSSYWMATFLWDLITAVVPIVISVVIFAAFQSTGYTGENLAAVALLLLLTCWALIPFVYCVSFFFKSGLIAFCVIVLYFLFSSQIFEVAVLVVTNTTTNKILHYLFLLDPAYALAISFYFMYSNEAIKAACTQSEAAKIACAALSSDPTYQYVDSIFEFSRPGIGHVFLYLALEGLLFFVLTLLIEVKFYVPKIKRLLYGHRAISGGVADGNNVEDIDVVAEQQRVLSGSADQAAVLLKRLTKVYPSSFNGCTLRPPKPAVRGISLGIPSGECFGLLGVNGAGKTTTFGILTGDISMTDGTAVIASYDIRTNLREVQQRIGYCPQFDALIDRLTGREHLALFARLRGIPEAHIKGVVDRQVERLDLSKHATRLCGTYSGGNKRKLSTALALVGDPIIAFLDEPTTGLDPATRRYLWDVLVGVVQDGRCIVLTSHSMEECEALCTRLAIMVNGQFKCLGSIQHLKSRFGAGLTLQAKVQMLSPEGFEARSLHKPTSGGSHCHSSQTRSPGSPEAHPLEKRVTLADPYDTSPLHIFICESFQGAFLVEEHQGQVTYRLPAAGLSWSLVFKALESNKERLHIVDYSISQTSLEQVFLNFAHEQEEEGV